MLYLPAGYIDGNSGHICDCGAYLWGVGLATGVTRLVVYRGNGEEFRPGCCLLGLGRGFEGSPELDEGESDFVRVVLGSIGGGILFGSR